MRMIVAFAVGVALIALGALVFTSLRPQTAQTIPLQPIEATPQRVATPIEPAPASPTPPAAVRAAAPLESRPQSAPSSPATDTTPEPSERPSDTDVTPPAPPSKPESTPPTPPAPSALPVRQTAQGWGVQAGAFKTSTNANALRDRLLKAGLAARVEAGEGGIYRVIVGAYKDADAARANSATVLTALK
jgi:cell division septation protein DedD